MNGLLGHIGVLLALLAALAGIVSLAHALLWRRAALATGAVAPAPTRTRPAIYFAWLSLAGALLATFAMEHALLTHDFSLSYVANNNARQTPLLYDITGMWSALQGSILLWGLILCGYVAACAQRFRAKADDALVRWALLICFCVVVFFFALMLGPADPFAPTRGAVPANGPGPNALLQDNTLIAFHPVLLYAGLVGFTIPFSFALASLITGRVGEGWLLATRRFTYLAWACLGLGIVLGAWWSYQTSGWGGYWSWDPVENAALIPWLTGTAFLHSVLVQERRGLLRIWNLSLIVATFSLTILATFLTRSGVTQSVHSFSASGVGPVLLGFFGVIVAAGVGLIGWRGDRLASPGSIDSPFSREGAFLVNNLLFAAFALVVLLGTVFPLFLQVFNNSAVTIGRPYFDAFSVPLGLALLFFMAVAPALPWRKASERLLRERLAVPAWAGVATIVACVLAGVRGLTPLAAFGLGAFAGAAALRQLTLAAIAAHRHHLGAWRGVVGRANGGMVTHLGVVVIGVALAAASAYGRTARLTLVPHQIVHFDGHVIELMAVRAFSTPSRYGDEAIVRVDHGTFRPAIDIFRGNATPVATPSVDSGFIDDVYLSAGGSLTTGAHPSASLDIFVQPFISWLWVGGAMIGAGALLAAVPGRRRRRSTDPSSLAIPDLAEELIAPRPAVEPAALSPNASSS